MLNTLVHKKYFWGYVISFVFIVLNGIAITYEIYYLPALPVLLIPILIAITALDKFLLLTVFFVPLSIPLSYIVGKIGVDISLPAEAFLIIILILTGLKFVQGQMMDRRIVFHPVSLAVYFYLGWTFITCITSSMPLVSFKFLIARIWFIAAFYFLAAQIFQDRKYIWKYLYAYLIPLIAVIVYVIVHHSTYGLTNQQVAYFVVKPFYNDHTSYGAVIAILIPVVAGLFFTKFRLLSNIQRVLFIMLILYLFIAVVFSYSRAAWVSLIAVFVIGVIIKLRIPWQFLLAGFLLVLFLVFSYRTEITMHLARNTQVSSGNFNEHLKSISNIRNDDSNLERLNRWGCAWRMFREKPVFGWGPGTYMFNYAPFQISAEKTNISTNWGTLGDAHSEYLGPLSESGLPGVISFIVIIVLTWITGMRVYLHSEKGKMRILSLSVLLGLTTFYIHGLLNNFLNTDKISALFWGFTAILVALDVYHTGKKRSLDQLPEN